MLGAGPASAQSGYDREWADKPNSVTALRAAKRLEK